MGAHLHGEAQSSAFHHNRLLSSAAVRFSEQFCLLPGAVQEQGAPDHRMTLG